jgi:hypothetical protein
MEWVALLVGEPLLQTKSLLLNSINTTKWATFIANHCANDHDWYDFLAANGSGEHFASFLKEESKMPSFVSLLAKLLTLKLPELARDTIVKNLKDEQVSNFPQVYQSISLNVYHP